MNSREESTPAGIPAVARRRKAAATCPSAFIVRPPL